MNEEKSERWGWVDGSKEGGREEKREKLLRDRKREEE